MNTNLNRKLVDSAPLIIYLLISAIMLLICFTPAPWWDGAYYYDDFLDKYNQLFIEHRFDVEFLISGLKLGTHAGHAVYLVACLGQLIAGWKGVYSIQSVLILLSDYCLFRLVEKSFPKLNKCLLALACSAYALSPYISGLGYEFGPYIYCTVFVVFALYFYSVKKWYAVTSIFLLAVYLSLETGIILVGVYIITDLVMQYASLKKADSSQSFWERVRIVLPLRKIILLLIPELFLLIPGIWYYPGKSSTTGSTEINNFAFNPYNIVMHFRQTFVSNLFWMYWILLLFAIILVYRSGYRLKINKSIFVPVLIAYAFYTAFICFLFVSTPTPRYCQLVTILYPFIAAVSLYMLSKNNTVVTCFIASLMTVCLVVQNFVSIDITTFMLYKRDLGRSTVYSPSMNEIALDIWLVYPNDVYAYNQQAAYGCDLLNDIFSYYEIDDNTVVLYSYFIYYDVLCEGRLGWNPQLKTVMIEQDDDRRIVNYQSISSTDNIQSSKCLLILTESMKYDTEPELYDFILSNQSRLVDQREFENFYGTYTVFVYDFD